MQPQQPPRLEDEGPNKAVHMMFLSGGLLLFLLVNWTADWIIGYWVKTPNDFMLNGIAFVVAMAVGIWMYRSDRVYTLAHEVASALEKVTWPTKEETQLGTIVVLVMVVISAFILGAFDFVWAALTDLIYG